MELVAVLRPVDAGQEDEALAEGDGDRAEVVGLLDEQDAALVGGCGAVAQDPDGCCGGGWFAELDAVEVHDGAQDVAPAERGEGGEVGGADPGELVAVGVVLGLHGEGDVGVRVGPVDVVVEGLQVCRLLVGMVLSGHAEDLQAAVVGPLDSAAQRDTSGVDGERQGAAGGLTVDEEVFEVLCRRPEPNLIGR
ncbi:hypothetical protein ACGFI9_31230 [Micromonospora sp. NPDC048930]|uniref:hypothetical protein n=1 Tax=Micromonospora sp. NPDC048930 TaxID=3364261 RepID=UPI00371C3AED